MNIALHTTFKHLRRSPYQSIAAITVMTITFFLVTIMALVFAGSEKIIRHFETRPQVTAFFTVEAGDETISSLKEKVQAIDGVSDINYVSQEQALKIYQDQNQNDPLLLEMVSADILPASIEVSTHNPETLTHIAQIMKQHQGVEEVIYQKDVVDTLISWTNTIRIAGLVLAFFLLFSSVTTIVIIIGLKITNRRHEIKIMRLVGASKWYIVTPFLLEGSFYGSTGSFIGWGVAYVTLLYSTPIILKFLGTITLLPVSIWFMLILLGSQLLLGITVGLISSLFASRRFLK